MSDAAVVVSVASVVVAVAVVVVVAVELVVEVFAAMVAVSTTTTTMTTEAAVLVVSVAVVVVVEAADSGRCWCVAFVAGDKPDSQPCDNSSNGQLFDETRRSEPPCSCDPHYSWSCELARFASSNSAALDTCDQIFVDTCERATIGRVVAV